LAPGRRHRSVEQRTSMPARAGKGGHARWLCMWQALWGAFSGEQHEPENNKPLGSEANEVLASGMFGR
jgi:hypothetical protein